MDPQSCRYTESHEWAFLEGEICTIGITQFAADQLSDITYLELPTVGATVRAGEAFGTVETVKAVEDLNAPCDGEVVEVNPLLEDDPGHVNQDPLGSGWMIKIRLAPQANLNHLLTWEQYQEQIAHD
jgi:glycine cleavage system H protein